MLIAGKLGKVVFILTKHQLETEGANKSDLFPHEEES